MTPTLPRAFPKPVAVATAALLAALLDRAPALAQDAVVVPQIVVTAPSRTPLEATRTGSSVSVLTREDLLQDPRPTLAETLERIPGVAVAGRGAPGSSTDVSVRGFGAEDLLVRIDGIELADPGELRTQADLGQLLTWDFGRIEVVKGAQSALYGGEAVGGVIDIATAQARGSGFEGRSFGEGGSLGTAAGGLRLGQGAEDWDLALTAQGFRTDGFSAARTGSERDGYRNVTLSAAGSADLTPDLTFGGAFRFLDRETDIDRISRGRPVDSIGDTASSRVFAGRAFLRHEAFDGRVGNELSVQRLASTREFDEAVAGRSRFEGDRIKLEWLATAAALPGLDLLAGADWTREDVETSDPLEADTSIAGGFGQAILAPLETLTLTGALRYDHHSEFDGFVTWRATAGWEPVPGSVLRGAVATGFRAPSTRELFSPEGAFGPVGNPHLEPEETFSWEIGGEQTLLGDRLGLSATWFRSRTDDLIRFVFGEGFAQVPGESRRQGVELGLDARLTGRVSLAASYTYLDAEDADGAPLEFVPEHDLRGALVARPFGRLRLSASASYLSGVIDSGRTLDPFVLVDATVGYELVPGVEAYARVENLLDQDYERVDGFATSGISGFAGLRARF